MAVKALIFGTDDMYPALRPLYEAEVQRGNMEIVGYADFTEDDDFELYTLEKIGTGTGGGDDKNSRRFD